ncbi:MAG: AAA family ATPase, partial [Patescibacteria group bacterium]
MDLFDQKLSQKLASEAPLAERMRPNILEDFVGQNEVIGPSRLLRQLIEKDEIPSMVFWGPPGSGKTTLARIIANLTRSDFVSFSAVTCGVKDLKEIIFRAEERRRLIGKRTILFIDEIHRWNKSQQDALLPHVERGIIILIGATTENPSFEINSALLSRCRVFVLAQLSPENLFQILKRALTDLEKGFGSLQIGFNDGILEYLAKLSNGDARIALNALEFAVKATKPGEGGIILDKEVIKESLQKTHHLY